MAVIRYFDNCFENDFIDVEYDFNKSLIEQIESHQAADYTSEMIECYDPEEDRTYYVPLTSSEDLDAVIIVNGKNVDENYQVQEYDTVNVMYLPMSDKTAEYAKDVGGGAVLGAIIGLVYFGVGVAVGTLTFGIGGLLFYGLGGAALGAILGAGVAYSTTRTNKNITDEKGKNLPDVRGGSNGSILNSPYAFTIGKHLVNPRIINDPYTKYSDDGKDAYIRAVYEVGYAPVKITDIKLDEFLLADNGTKGGTNYINGLFKTIKTEDDSGNMVGEIDGHWSNNDVEVEILQHNPNSSDVNYGHIYPDVVKQKEVNANTYFINDKDLGETAKSVTYKGKTFASRFRTNGVWFTESCPSSFSITLNAPNGLYDSYTKTSKENGNTNNATVFDKLPLWYAVQWRPYSKFNDTSKAEGEDYGAWNNITVWNGKDCSLSETDDKTPIYYDSANYKKDKDAHKGNDIDAYSETEKTVEVQMSHEDVIATAQRTAPLTFLFTQSCLAHSSNGMYFGSDIKKYRISGSDDAPDSMYWGKFYNKGGALFPRDIVCDSESQQMWFDSCNSFIKGKLLEDLVTITLDTPITIPMYYAVKVNEYSNQGLDTGTTKSFTIKYITFRRSYYYTQTALYNPSVGYWCSNSTIKRTLCNFERFTGKGEDYDFTGQVRLTANVELSAEQKAQMLRSDNTIKGIEIRVIRISPNYINQTDNTSDTESAHSYSDSLIVDMITTTPFDEDYYKDNNQFRNVKFQSEDLVKKMCYIAVKAKADDLGTISQQLRQLSCTVESFSPVWQDHKWLPEGVKRVTNYYGYYTDRACTTKCNRTISATEVNLNQHYIIAGKSKDEAERLAKIDYETARGEGYSWYADEIGSNFSDLIKSEVFPSDNSCHTTLNTYPADSLPDSAIKFNDATAASGFMLAAVGAQNGRHALGYENIDLLSVAECYDAQQSVEDGSTYSEPDGQHLKGASVKVKFEANGYIYQTSKLEEILAKIAIAGRSVYTYDNCGRIRMVMDKPVDYPRGVINQQNCISHTANYSYEKLPAGLRLQFPDENDGYEQNSLYCWADGNSMKNYKGNVENYNFDFVTNNAQAWSLGRYVLANRVLNREALTAKIGMEGETWSLGDVIVFQDEDLLIGDGSGRIKEIICNSTTIYGFIMDSVYTYTGETVTEEGVTRSTKGVQIFAPKKYGEARVLDFRLATPDYSVTVDGEEYQMTVGETNLILFELPVNINTSVEEIHEDDIVMFGDYSKVSARYRITKIKPEKDHTFTYNLVQYTEELYNYGRELPAFQNFMTIPSPTAEGSSLSETPSSVKEFMNNNTALRNSMLQGMLAGSKPYYAVTNSNVMPDINVFNEAETEEDYVPGVFCSSFSLVTSTEHYNEQNRYLWSGVRYIYADGTMALSISNVSLSVYGAQGVAGTDFRFDLSPETMFLNPSGNSAFVESSITFSCFLYKETVSREIDSIDCYYKLISDDNKLTISKMDDIYDGEVYLGKSVTIPTNQLSSYITNRDTFPIIVVCKFTDDEGDEKSRMATVSISSNTSGTKYYFYLNYTNIKINQNGDIYPEYITATPLKMTTEGVFVVSEGEGGNVIKYRILPGGQYKTVGHEKVKSTDTYDDKAIYHAKFNPEYTYKVNTDGSYDYGKYWTTACPDGVVRTMVFFNRV